jgi:hypothetical protein
MMSALIKVPNPVEYPFRSLACLFINRPITEMTKPERVCKLVEDRA